MRISLSGSLKGVLARASRERSWVVFGLAVIAAGGLALLGNGDQTQMLFSTCLFIVLAYGWNIISGLAGYVSFGQIGFFGIGAYVAATCQLQLHMDWYAAAGMGGLAAVIVAIPLGMIMLRLQGIFFALGMFGLSSIGALLATSSSFVGGSQGESVPVVGIPQETALVMLGLACAAAVLTGWLLHSRLGLQLMAIRDDEMAAAASGVDTRSAKVIAFCLSAGLAALAGGLYIWNIGFIDPGSAFSSTFELQTILMVLIGGIGTQWGPLFGAVIVSAIGQALWAQFPLQQEIILGALTLIGVIWMPGGIVSLLNRLGWLRRHPIWGSQRAALHSSSIPRRDRLLVSGEAHHKPNGGHDQAVPAEYQEQQINSFTDDHDEHSARPVLQCEQLTRRFGGLVALNHIDVEVQSGQILAIIGPNGAGKTTLFNLITGFDRCNEGSIRFMGRDISRRASYLIAREGIARTFQTSRPFPSLSVWETLLLTAISRNTHKDQAIAEAHQMLSRLGLSEQWERPPDRLPPGQQRMLEIGRALMLHPRVLLLDEAMAGMTPAEIARVHALLKDAVKQGCAVITIEHVLPAIVPIANHVHVLDFGVTIAQGSPSEVFQNPAVIDAYLGTGEEATINA
jgi:branched-chain amino acid transport system permease protein